MPRSDFGFLLCLSLLLACVQGCDNDCDFFERCNGGVRQVCGDGPDQVIGRRIHDHPCEAPNTACVELDERHTACVHAPVSGCDDAYAPSCQDNVILRCMPNTYLGASSQTRYLQAQDCATYDNPEAPNYTPDASALCRVDEQGARCLYPAPR